MTLSPFNTVTGALPLRVQNLPYDRHGCVDQVALRRIQLQGYSTAELEAELARRIDTED